MKKLLYCAAALAMTLFAGSCQKENLESEGGNIVTYTVQVPDALSTKAIGTDVSAVTELVYEVYRFDYENNEEDRLYQKTLTRDVADANWTVELELVNNQDFRVLFWAQVPNNGVYNTDNLTTVTLSTDLDANAENYAAFAGQTKIEYNNGFKDGNIILVRPVAQLNIATSAESLVLGEGGSVTTTVTFDETSVEVKGLSNVYNVAAEEAVADNDGSAYIYNATNPKSLSEETITVNSKNYTYVSMNYVGFIPKAGDNVDVKYTIVTDNVGTITNEIKNVPVKANYRTNIIGNLITSTSDYTVELSNQWPAEDYKNIEVVSVSTAADLQHAIDEIPDGVEGNIKLEGDIVLSSPSTKTSAPTYGLIIPSTKSLILDLNGHTLSQTVNQTGAYSMIQNNGVLTIIDGKGNGKISYKDEGNGGEYVSNTILNNGTLVIESGLIENNSSEAVASNGYPHPIDNNAVLTVNGGTIINNANYSSMRIWCTTDDNTSVTINGGTFNGSIDFQTVDVKPNKGVLTINGGTFNADTYTNCAVRLLGFGADVDEMFGYINGGIFNGEIARRNWSGAEFNSKVFYITGGIFSYEPTEFLANGYATEQDDTDKWIIKQCPVKIGDTFYATLADAVEAVQDDETITILADKILEEGTIKLPAALKNVTFMGESGATLKDMKISAADGNSYNYQSLTFKGITFDNSRIILTGWRNGEEVIENLTVTECVFKNLNDNTSEAPLHINMDASEVVKNLTFTNNVIDGATGGSKSGIYAQVTGQVLVSGNVINNVAFRPYIIQVTTDDGVADNFVVTNNTFSGSAAGRAQGLGNNAEGTDDVIIEVTENVFKGITDAQQICYWNFNPAKTTANLSHNYYDIDILANPGKIYYNSAAANKYDLADMGVFPIYTDESKTTLYTPELNSAKIGDTEYATLQEAVAAAKAGDTIRLLSNLTLSEALTLPADITFNGNGKQINGTLKAGGDVTFEGHTKATLFNASSNNTITIGDGACLEVTGTGRVSFGYGNEFDIEGTVATAKTADKSKIQPSLIIPGGISITGGSDLTFNVKDAYVQIGSTTSKNNAANGTFTMSFENSIVEFTNQFTLAEPTGGMDPTFNVNFKDCQVTTSTKLCIAAPNTNVVIDNSTVTLGTYLRNSGNIELKNASILTGKTIQFGENGGNNGAITVDNSSFTIVAGSTGHAFDGKNTGSITAKNAAEVSVDYYKAMTIYYDATSTFTGTEVL